MQIKRQVWTCDWFNFGWISQSCEKCLGYHPVLKRVNRPILQKVSAPLISKTSSQTTRLWKDKILKQSLFAVLKPFIHIFIVNYISVIYWNQIKLICHLWFSALDLMIQVLQLLIDMCEFIYIYCCSFGVFFMFTESYMATKKIGGKLAKSMA